MADFVAETVDEVIQQNGENISDVVAPNLQTTDEVNKGDNDDDDDDDDLPKYVAVKYGQSPIYCAICSLPPEYCEYGPSYDQCLPWILKNCPEQLEVNVLAKALGKVTIDDNKEESTEGKKKKKRGGASVPKKVTAVDTKVLIARIQRQKRKYITSVVGLDTVPDLKLKDAARIFGKKFSSGASLSDTPTGGKEIVIQGDVSYELPSLLITQFKISGSAIFLVEDGVTRPYEG
eukprot:CAMPEP_0182420028 /NCGR_PEP_ID=MMETSP1167-20130531/4511_1 /TAXON_ID=2988 /ORGANISM="Mallomonas Sp, Strain CCMP3275" /LENGTH=232 /DNA_ID=CAMNT_0024595399 /DNA_START=18 /DNA_END=716 /DNA_ORIENTATION=+